MLWLISKFMTSLTEQQIITIHILPIISGSKGPFKKDVTEGGGYPKIVTNGDMGRGGMFKW